VTFEVNHCRFVSTPHSVCTLISNMFVLSSWDCIISIATHYELDSSKIESQWGRDFLHLSRPALEPTQTPVQWVLGLFLRGKAGLLPGGKACGIDDQPLSSAKVERVYLYFHFPSGSTCPVLGWTFLCPHFIVNHVKDQPRSSSCGSSVGSIIFEWWIL
jgi:hypothetical protein